jgi:hypothetical protein
MRSRRTRTRKWSCRDFAILFGRSIRGRRDRLPDSIFPLIVGRLASRVAAEGRSKSAFLSLR